jgi:hypothetical protein
MKLIKDMNRDELMELVAAVSLRISAFIYAIVAFRIIYHLSLYVSQGGNPHGTTANDYYMDILFYTLIAAVMFILTIPLARLLCRGLSHALEPKSVE